MKSTFFENNIEYQIEVNGENWNQGEIINGELKIINRDNKELLLESAKIVLAHGLKKAIKEKNESVWEVQENLVLAEDIYLPPNKIETFKWSFKLKTDCPITDKMGSLYLLFGGREVLSRGGRLNLNIKLHTFLQNFLQTFTTQFRFLEKYQKRKNDWTEIKLIPPESREFPNLENLSCLLRIHKEKIEVNYLFKMKGLGRSGNQMKITKKNREIFQAIEKEDYLQPGGFPNRICFRENIDKALNIARPEVIF